MNTSSYYQELANKIKSWGKSFGFQQVGIADLELSQFRENYQNWLAKGYHGEMSYMENNQDLRFEPSKMVEGTLRVISVRMDYLPEGASFTKPLKNPSLAYISRYALGRDYHKLMRKRLKQFAEHIRAELGELGYRPFVDSAPVLERQLAEKAGLGWTGKHSLIINKSGGSWFFLGELFIDLPLPVDSPVEEHCGQCVACMTICPTQAIVAPYQVDARRCISYLTIELREDIPEELRPLIGNRIYGCDDCQLICPWNRYAKLSAESDFQARPLLFNQPLLALLAWSESEFLTNTEGSPIRRIGHECWQRNVLVALGNAPFDATILQRLRSFHSSSDMVMRHAEWAITQQMKKSELASSNSRKTLRLIKSVEKGLPRDA